MEFLFLFSNLYIKCNVRSCQYSTFVSKCVSPVSFHQRQWRWWCQDRIVLLFLTFRLFILFFFTSTWTSFITRSAIFNSIWAKWLCLNKKRKVFIFLCSVTALSVWLWSLYFFFCFVWWCCPATVAELWGVSEEGLTRMFVRSFFLPLCWNSCTD